MSDQGRPKVSDLILMTVYHGQRKKAGVSRVVIRNALVDTYGISDDKRTTTRIRDTIKKLIDENILDPITQHSFHLTNAGVGKANTIKSSEAWKRYNDRLSGKTTKSTKKQTTKKQSKTTRGKSTRANTTTSKGGAKKQTSPKNPSTPKGKSRVSSQKKRAQPTRNKRQHFDAVIPKTPSASIKASEERKARLERSQQRHEEMWVVAHRERRKRVSSRKAVTTVPKSDGKKASVGKKRAK